MLRCDDAWSRMHRYVGLRHAKVRYGEVWSRSFVNDQIGFGMLWSRRVRYSVLRSGRVKCVEFPSGKVQLAGLM